MRRRIIREHEFEEQLAAIIPSAEEADEYIHAAEALLAEDPELGVLVHEKQKIYLLGLQPIKGRDVTLYYTFGAKVVIFLWILIEAPSEK